MANLQLSIAGLVERFKDLSSQVALKMVPNHAPTSAVVREFRRCARQIYAAETILYGLRDGREREHYENSKTQLVTLAKALLSRNVTVKAKTTDPRGGHTTESTFATHEMVEGSLLKVPVETLYVNDRPVIDLEGRRARLTLPQPPR